MMPSCMHMQTFFSICMILPFLNAQSLHIFRPNQTYSDAVCPTASLGTKSQVITETQCARCYRNDPSCVAFHYSGKERVCHFYNLTVFGVILQDMCDHASGFQFYMQDGAFDDYWNAQNQVDPIYSTPTSITGHLSSHVIHVTGHQASPTSEGMPVSTTSEHIGTTLASDWQFHLVDGTSPNNGRIEVIYNGTTAQVCDGSFNSDDADQICNALGLSENGFPIYGSYFGDNPSGYTMLEYDCNADHTWCNDENMMYTICKSVGVECTDSPEFRLTNGTAYEEHGAYHGRIEINLAGVWGTVCSLNLIHDYTSMHLLCRQVESYTYSSVFSTDNPGTGPIWLQHVDCNGTAPSIVDCLIDHDPGCEHSDDISIYCY